jgi:hypothetical protein
VSQARALAASKTGFAEKKTVSIAPTRFTCTGTLASAAAAASPSATLAEVASSLS